MGPLSQKLMLSALKRLDELLTKPLQLVVGGGGAMVLAHQFPLSTSDLDAFPKGMDLSDFDLLIKQIAKEQALPGDWLNPYFSTFAHILPHDYGSRLVKVLEGRHLRVEALGREDLLIMKVFAHRTKDIPHARALLKAGVDMTIVENQIERLKVRKIKGCDEAVDFLDTLLDEIDERS